MSGLTLDEVNGVSEVEVTVGPAFDFKSKHKQAMIKRIEKELRVVIRQCKKRKDRLWIKVHDSLELSAAETQEKLGQAKERIQSLNGIKVRKQMTHFVSIPLTFDHLNKRVNQFFDQVLEDEQENKKRNIDSDLCVDVNKFHLTLAPLCLDTPQKLVDATQLLTDCVEKLIKPLLKQTPDALTVNLKGLDIMDDRWEHVRVLFASVQDSQGQSPPPHLQKLANEVTQKFAQHQLLYGDRLTVKLHATLMKSSNRKSKDKRKAFDASEIFKRHSNFIFGQEIRMNEIHLSCLAGVDEKQYYKPLIRFEY